MAVLARAALCMAIGVLFILLIMAVVAVRIALRR